MSIRVAVIEVSHWHALKDAAYLTHLGRLPDVDIVALHDPDEKVAKRMAEEIGGTEIYTDYREMLEKVKPDFLIVLGRHNVMAETAHYLLDNNYPFMMEKPMGVSAGEVESIADKADATKGFAAVPFFMRYMPFVIQAEKMIADGSFGTLSHFYARLNRPSSERYVNWGAAWMLDPEIAGGGCLRNVGLHGLDMFLHLLQENAQVTGAEISGRALGKDVEDYTSVLLRSESGILGTIEAGNTFPYAGPPSKPGDVGPPLLGGDGEYKLSGSDAMLMFKDGVMRVITRDSQDIISIKPEGPPPMLILRDTLTRWQNGETPVTSARDCLKATELVDQAYALAKPI